MWWKALVIIGAVATIGGLIVTFAEIYGRFQDLSSSESAGFGVVGGLIGTALSGSIVAIAGLIILVGGLVLFSISRRSK